MFQTKLIARFHHLYMIQALVEIQRHCNKLYTKLKHTIVYLVCDRLQLNRFLNSIEKNEENYCYNNNGYYDNQLPNIYSEGVTKSIFNDLDEILINRDGVTNKRGFVESVPMLLLPFVVQPHGFVRNNVRGLDDSSSSPTSYYNYHGSSGSNNSNNNNKNIDTTNYNSQQWQNRSDKQGNVCSIDQFITLVPSQLRFCAQSQVAKIPVSKHQSSFMATFEQQQQQQQQKTTNQPKFCTQKAHADDQRLFNSGIQTNSCRSSWSFRSRFSTTSTTTTSAAANDNNNNNNNHYSSNRGLTTIRNPLLNYTDTATDYARKRD